MPTNRPTIGGSFTHTLSAGTQEVDPEDPPHGRYEPSCLVAKESHGRPGNIPVGASLSESRGQTAARAGNRQLQGNYFAPSFFSQRANVLFSGSWQMAK